MRRLMRRRFLFMRRALGHGRQCQLLHAEEQPFGFHPQLDLAAIDRPPMMAQVAQADRRRLARKLRAALGQQLIVIAGAGATLFPVTVTRLSQVGRAESGLRSFPQELL